MCTSLTNSTTQQNSAKNARTDTKSVQPGQIGQTHARYHRLLAGYGGRVDAREVGWRRGNSCTCASYTQSNHTRPMTCLRTARHPPGRRTALVSLRVCAAGDPPLETVVVTTTNAAPRPQLKAALEGRSKGRVCVLWLLQFVLIVNLSKLDFVFPPSSTLVVLWNGLA